MTDLSEQVYAQAIQLAGDLSEGKQTLLGLLCTSAAATLAARLREGITPGDCRESFVTAASFFALEALDGADGEAAIQEFRAGDLTVKEASGGGSAAKCLRREAETLMAPYLTDRFQFQGV